MRSTINLVLAGLLTAPFVRANPYHPLVGFVGEQHTARPNGSSLELRGDCANPCGWHNQYCCGSEESCTTIAGDIAVCTAGGGGGGGGPAAEAGDGYTYFTTTYIEQGPVTITSTGSYLQSPAAQTPAAGSPIACASGGSCGSVCCLSNQYCVEPGKCANVGASQSAPIRPTSNAVATATTSGAQTTIVATGGVSTPTGLASASTSSSGLSPGAIAGIVIGVLLGVFLLFLILACLCCKGIIDGMLAILGCGRKRRVEETTVIESRHSHHSHHGSGSRPPQRTWYGFRRPGRTTEVVEERKKTGMGGLLGVGAFLGTLAILLGLKRRRDRAKSEKDEGSYSSVSYYSYEDDYTTSASSASSDRRTRSHRGSVRGSGARGSRR